MRIASEKVSVICCKRDRQCVTEYRDASSRAKIRIYVRAHRVYLLNNLTQGADMHCSLPEISGVGMLDVSLLAIGSIFSH